MNSEKETWTWGPIIDATNRKDFLLFQGLLTFLSSICTCVVIVCVFIAVFLALPVPLFPSFSYFPLCNIYLLEKTTVVTLDFVLLFFLNEFAFAVSDFPS